MTSNTLPRLTGFDYSALRTYFVTFCVQNKVPVFAEAEAARLACASILDFRAKRWYWRSIIYRCKLANMHIKWQPSFYDRIVRDYELSGDFVEYILMNPVRAGLVKNFDEYPFSGRVDSWD